MKPGVILWMVLLLAACGSDGESKRIRSADWHPGVYHAAKHFSGYCANPRSGSEFPDRSGRTVDENNWLRSWSHDTYLWYRELPDLNPASFSTSDYFTRLKTEAVTPSGTPKDQYHFSMATQQWREQSQSGVSAGYGLQWALLTSSPPRQIRVAYTEPSSPATDAATPVTRGMTLLAVDGLDVINSPHVDQINAALFPAQEGLTHTFTFETSSAEVQDITLTSARVMRAPVREVSSVDTADGRVGYLLFNTHIATAEEGLVAAFEQLVDLGVSDLVLDLRYNGGGFLDIASMLGFMIAGDERTQGRVFEKLTFNDKYPNTNPVTGERLQPLGFHSQTRGFSLPSGAPLPSLNLDRVFVLTGGGTCSASESVINGLHGIGVEVIQIGTRTCGKPYGFYGTDNCGETYFTVQFRGENDAGFGDYADGFAPAGDNVGEQLPGCRVADDFDHALGDADEARFQAALHYRAAGTCATPPAGLAKSGFIHPEPLLPRPLWIDSKWMPLP